MATKHTIIYQSHFELMENLSDEQKLEKSFRLILSRTPTDKERKMLKDYYTLEKSKFTSKQRDAKKFLNEGELDHIQTKDIASTAALMQINQMLFNIDETTIK